jgi:hypothetical protein
MVIPIARSRIDESFGPPARLDYGGFGLACGAALGLVWGLVRGNQVGWSSAEVVASLTAGTLLTGRSSPGSPLSRRPGWLIRS